ncbi:hypothetical protein WMW72_23820 [Paenibacillus filicis]|uniref:Uncharacterized protein n=1 Tax=Paenibacillus filicis TaxID=669464 RepID=A0ABU9DPZ1_9BACL
MDPIDSKWKQQLINGPFDQDGFTDALRQRIETRLEQHTPSPSTSVWKRPWIAAAGAALFLGLFVLGFAGERLLAPDKLAVMDQKKVPHSASAVVNDYEAGVRSAVLVGLRTDVTIAGSPGYKSEYRTLLIAPEASRLQVTAEGSGILMPYKMDFWRLGEEYIPTAEGGSVARVTAKLAEPARQLPVPSRNAVTKSDLLIALQSEKLVFVGNRYVAMEQSVLAKDVKGGLRNSNYVWVKDVPQLSAKATTPASAVASSPLQQPHVKLQDLYKTGVEPALRSITPVLPAADRTNPKATLDTAGESWTVVRQQGRWVAQVASYETVAADEGARYKLKNFPLDLPVEVVSHDQLVTDWADIKRVQPAAVDAYSSPNQDVVLVVTDRHLIVYPYQGALLSSPLLTVELQPQESVIMAHWAIDPYIDPWKKKVSTLLAQ